ncbi:putative nuclease HARBI1 [Sitophilus oryzae]|uniref:Nuclease HARBI1 n=1 Tax=Sitophilus oryzae TaxID=7048 RepID=A0A6J2X841_SITOR|nr:putative nuclease HARBI1 [Sitophilus oryzae]
MQRKIEGRRSAGRNSFDQNGSEQRFQSGVAENIGVSQGTVSLTVKYVAKKITEKAAVWIKFPSTIQEIDAAKNQWLEKYKFPTAIGALDCTQVKIKKVGIQRHGGDMRAYICRKGFASINVQATCDANEVFKSVSAEWPGSVHDSRIWRNSATCRTLRRFDNAILRADQGYGIENCVMTPFVNPQTPEQLAYNNLFKRERVVIERYFGQLKQRFPILQNIVRLSLASVPTIIIACFILHNVAKFFMMMHDDALDDVDDNENNENDGECGETEANEDDINNFRLLGQNKRNRLAELIYSRL